jgi:hypothetical protein
LCWYAGTFGRNQTQEFFVINQRLSSWSSPRSVTRRTSGVSLTLRPVERCFSSPLDHRVLFSFFLFFFLLLLPALIDV